MKSKLDGRTHSMLWARPKHTGRVSRRSRIHKADSRSWHSMNMQMAECGCVGADLQQMAWLAAYSRCTLNLHLVHFNPPNSKWQQSEVSAFNTYRHRREVVLRLHTVCGLALLGGRDPLSGCFALGKEIPCPTRIVKVASIQCSHISERALLFWKFPGFAPLSFF